MHSKTQPHPSVHFQLVSVVLFSFGSLHNHIHVLQILQHNSRHIGWSLHANLYLTYIHSEQQLLCVKFVRTWDGGNTPWKHCLVVMVQLNCGQSRERPSESTPLLSMIFKSEFRDKTYKNCKHAGPRWDTWTCLSSPLWSHCLTSNFQLLLQHLHTLVS